MFDVERDWVAGMLGPDMIRTVTSASAVRRPQTVLEPGSA